MKYHEFLKEKAQLSQGDGFAPVFVPDFLFDFQKSLVDWAVRRGRCAIFADCGLGKTPMQLVWAENVARKTNGRVLVLTPLAVSHQTVAEAAKFGISAKRSHGGELHDGINVTNYERLEKFNPADFAGVVCDESSILKSFDGVRRSEITEFMRKMHYRLLCTATAAPNDYIELGTSSEALGELGYMDMLSRFFKNDQNSNNANRLWEGAKFRFKGHAEVPFWRWVCSWARAVRRPSDLGFDDGKFHLPPLVENEHIVEADELDDGMLFSLPAVGLKEQRDELRRSIEERCKKAVDLTAHKKQAIVWCHLNQEGNDLEKAIKGATQVSGEDSDDSKEEKFMAFAAGEIRVLVTKPKIGAWGLNFQNCAHITNFPSHSFEQYYQAVRRCWRFGQQQKVIVDIIATEGQRGVMANLQRKSQAADKMFSRLVESMNSAMGLAVGVKFTKKEEVPSWL